VAHILLRSDEWLFQYLAQMIRDTLRVHVTVPQPPASLPARHCHNALLLRFTEQSKRAFPDSMDNITYDDRHIVCLIRKKRTIPHIQANRGCFAEHPART
jgi:hypothetical protein